MKKFAILFFALLMCVSACSCGLTDEIDSILNMSLDGDTSEQSQADVPTVPETSAYYDLLAIKNESPLVVTKYEKGIVTVKNNTEEQISSLELFIASFDEKGEFVSVKSALGKTSNYSSVSCTTIIAPNGSVDIKVLGEIPDVEKAVISSVIVVSYTTSEGTEYHNKIADEWAAVCIGMIPDHKEPEEPVFDGKNALYALRALDDKSNVKISDIDKKDDTFVMAIKNESGTTVSTVWVAIFAVDADGNYVEISAGSTYLSMTAVSNTANGKTMYVTYAAENMDRVVAYEAIVASYDTADGKTVNNETAAEFIKICESVKNG